MPVPTMPGAYALTVMPFGASSCAATCVRPRTATFDAEYAPMFERVREAIPKVTDVLVFDGPAPDGMTAVDELIKLPV